MPRKKSFKKTFLLKIKIPAILAGIFLMAGGTFLSNQENIIRILDLSPKVQAQEEVNLPIRLEIPDINLVAQIKPGGFINHKWVLDSTGVFFDISSSEPGKGKTTIIYGHDKKNLLANLKNITEKKIITLVTQTGTIYNYEVVSKELCKPSNMAILQSTTPDTLIIYTCDGIFDQKRLVVKAKII